jgi:catechol 2,3-dioxygenase-like lactoylglutathione lyase family enzyme
MDCKIELIFVPVTDVDRAISFYVEKVGFSLDIQEVGWMRTPGSYLQQLPPPGSYDDAQDA